jgi:hypothetical protein
MLFASSCPSPKFLVPECLSDVTLPVMRYLVKARVKPGQDWALVRAIDEGTLGRGSVAGDEYLNDMEHARVGSDGTVSWIEVCFCTTPLAEERPYWEEYFELFSVRDAHARKNCRDLHGQEPWACCECDCTRRLGERLAQTGDAFLERLRRNEKKVDSKPKTER